MFEPDELSHPHGSRLVRVVRDDDCVELEAARPRCRLCFKPKKEMTCLSAAVVDTTSSNLCLEPTVSIPTDR